MSNGYEVGYKKPPKRTRFKKGQSGNPKGRRKASRNMSTIMLEVMARPVVIKQNGQRRRVAFREAFVHRLAGRALEGNTRDMIALMKAMHDYLPESLEPERNPRSITVTYVLPDGKTMESYDGNGADLDKSSNDPTTSPAHRQPDCSGDEDDTWLE